METSSRDRISVDVHGLKAVLTERAQAYGCSPSQLVRKALTDALCQPADVAAGELAKVRATSSVARVRLCLRMRPEDAAATLQAAHRAGMTTGDYLAGLVAGVPALLEGGGHAETVALLTTATAELATLSRNLYQVNSMLRRGEAELPLPYRSMLDALARDVRQHLDLASIALADLQPSRPSNGKPAGRNQPNTRRSHP
ncbi:hypothetical protein CBP34_12295 [Acidovorax carolinensis]|uniref:Uncharacterized protein n=1 Tax=Acidovorax carolinensis TaxID=553814 RepID=A0A240U351_9BURK|nr:hypothetical protein [Acidovorax carolinensis]ART52275.1 hypothetical protein CBP34_12295 [Acidovorax carolinensis]